MPKYTTQITEQVRYQVTVTADSAEAAETQAIEALIQGDESVVFVAVDERDAAVISDE